MGSISYKCICLFYTPLIYSRTSRICLGSIFPPRFSRLLCPRPLPSSGCNHCHQNMHQTFPDPAFFFYHYSFFLGCSSLLHFLSVCPRPPPALAEAFPGNPNSHSVLPCETPPAVLGSRAHFHSTISFCLGLFWKCTVSSTQH